MTPKEKAKELFNKYATYVVMWKGDVNMIHQNCKQCALIAVDEIVESDWFIPTEEDKMNWCNYWQEVKQEIENL